MYEQTSERFGGVDVLYNNAGISPGDDASVLETSVEAWQRVQDVNAKGVFLCCKHGIPHLLEARRRLGDQRRLVRRDRGRRHLADLVHGVEGRVLSMSRELAVEFAREGVRVNALCPGPVETPLLLSIFGDDPAAFERRRSRLADGEAAKPREIVRRRSSWQATSRRT